MLGMPVNSLAAPSPESSTRPDMTDSNAHVYLEYLDKEMTIMGVLSGFAIGSVALVAHAFSATLLNNSSLVHLTWNTPATLVVVATVAQLVAALFFYKQRSVLAWHYGQLCLIVFAGGTHNGVSTRSQVEDADSWATWIAYRIAFIWLCLGYVYYVIAVVNTLIPAMSTAFSAHPIWLVAILLPIPGAALWCLAIWLVLTAFGDEAHPWRTFRAKRNTLLARLRKARDQNRL
jgi:hypothetical protein